MQDEIVARLANQLQAELIEAEARRAEEKPNPDSLDLYFQGQARFNRGMSPEILSKARGYFERALALDSNNLDALIGIALADAVVAFAFALDDSRSALAEAEANLTKCLARAPNNARAHVAMGMVFCATTRASQAKEEWERALAIDPNLARARGLLGLAYLYLGRAEETEAHVIEALRLSPRDSTTHVWFQIAGLAKTLLGEWEDALTRLRKSLEANPNNPWASFHLAACLAHLGRLDEARAAARTGAAVNPKFTIKRFRALGESDNAVFLAQRERAIEGMRKAGVPEE
jgi:tetratricopeptide (TPR) repeat protein